MSNIITELMNNTAVISIVSAVAGAAATFFGAKLKDFTVKVNAYVKGTPNTVDDAVLEAIEKAIVKLITVTPPATPVAETPKTVDKDAAISA